MNTGTITEIIGPVVDVHFEKERPAIQEALVIEKGGEHGRIVLSSAAGLGESRLGQGRCQKGSGTDPPAGKSAGCRTINAASLCYNPR